MKFILDIPDKYITVDTSPMYWISNAGNDCKIRPLLEENETIIERVERCGYCKYKNYLLGNSNSECIECLKGITDYYVPEGD